MRDEPNHDAWLARIFTEQQIREELTLSLARQIADETGLPLRSVESFALARGVVPCRYRKNIGSIGLAGQKTLLDSAVLVAGLGGLGGYVVEQLARAGLGRIRGADPDVFEETNLNRQIISETGNLGCRKTDEVARRIARINPATEFSGFPLSFEQLPDDTYRGMNLVFDCLDGIEKRLRLAERCSRAMLPLIHGAIGGFCGQVSVIWPGTGRLEKICDRQKQGVEQALGNLPFTAAVAASMMAAEGAKVLLGMYPEPVQKLTFFDLREGEWQTLSL